MKLRSRIPRVLPALLLAVTALGQTGRPENSLFPPWPKAWTMFNVHKKDCHIGVRDARGRLVLVGVETKGDKKSVTARQQITLLVHERGFWSDPIEISRPGVVYFPALAVAGDGAVWVAWSEFDGETWQIKARHWKDARLSAPIQVSRDEVNLMPSLLVDGGEVTLAWQAARDGRFEIQAASFDGRRWSEPATISRAGEHEFRPRLALDSNGKPWLVWDRFGRGRYQVFAKVSDGAAWSTARPVFDGAEDTIAPRIAADRSGRVWVLASGRLAALDAAGQRYELAASLPDWRGGPDFLCTDPKGRLWLLKAIGARSSFDWTAGYRNAQTGIAVVDSAGLHELPVQNTFLRFDDPQVDEEGNLWVMNEMQFLRFDHPAPSLAAAPPVRSAPIDPAAFRPGRKQERPHFSLAINGAQRHLYWAEMHDHLRELPLEPQMEHWVDRFYLTSRHRFGLDAAAITDHDWPGMTRSMYFLEQAVAGVLQESGSFLAFAGVEWSGDSQVRARFGDRTVLFPDGYHEIPRITDEIANTAAKLSRQVARLGALDWPHHIGRLVSPVPPASLNRATEPVVEMTSGHGVFETYDPRHALPIPYKTQITLGTSMQDILAAGKRVGMVGSSDSHSGFPNPRVGMLAVAAPALTKKAIMEAILDRRTYALRGDKPIYVDFRADGHALGSEYTSKAPVQIEIQVRGTEPITRIDLVRNNEYILTKRYGDGALERNLDYRDLEVIPAYYYVRIFQAGDAWAWTSPIWVDRD